MEPLSSKEIILNGEALFIPTQRKLFGSGNEVLLTENESRLLCMLLMKTCDKKEVMQEIWGARGIIVTESSYYKLVKKLRCTFSTVGLEPTLIITLPRIGIRYIGTQKENDSNTKKIINAEKRLINTLKNTITPLSLLFYLTCIALFVLT
jgi:DNA-binding winged helix-turn-helix (wHTH) protein